MAQHNTLGSGPSAGMCKVMSKVQSKACWRLAATLESEQAKQPPDTVRECPLLCGFCTRIIPADKLGSKPQGHFCHPFGLKQQLPLLA